MPLTATPAARLLVTAILLFTLSGCVNLDDAAGLSRLSEQAKRALPRVSNDVAATCARQNILFQNTPAAERPPTEQAQDCAPYQEVSSHLDADQKALAGYFDALGQLSSNKPLTYDAAIGANVTSIRTNTAFSANTITAGTDAEKILKSLADAATKSYREKQLGELIQANDPAIQSLTQALKKVITVDYAQLLSGEELSLDNFYQAPMAAAQPNERLALILVQRQYAHDKSALASRKASIADYGRVMDNMATLHSKLKQQAEKKASVIDIAKELGPTIAALKDAISDLESRSN
jgi:hypothetical protein